MQGEEHYAEESHGIFPRFILASLLIGLLVFLPELALSWNPQLVSSELLQLLSVYEYAMVPFGAFLIFYLAARVRVDLGRDYARIALSILLGSLFSIAVFTFPLDFAGAGFVYPDGSIVTLSVWFAAALLDAANYTFIGFCAVLLSYYRRM